MTKNRKILVTGVTGFIGSNLTRALANDNHIIGIARVIPEQTSRAGNIHFIKHDLLDADLTEDLPEDIDTIIHLAAITDPEIIERDRIHTFDVNVRGTARLLEYGRKIAVNDFIYASTGSVYGYHTNPVGEDAPPKPDNFYALMKYTAELLVRDYSKYFKTLILRYFYPYGPGQPERMLIPRLINNIKRGKTITIYNAGNPVTSPIYISDLTNITIKTLSIGDSETLNVAGKERYSILDIGRLISSILGTEARYSYVDDERVSNLIPDTTKLESLVDFRYEMTLEKGIRELLAGKK